MEATTHITAYLHSEPHRCRIVVEELKLKGKSCYRVCLFLPKGRICEDTCETIGDALRKIRQQIEPYGWRLAINAARFNAMTGSEFNDVYTYLPDHAGVWQRELALGPAPLAELATVEQQESFSKSVLAAHLGPSETQAHGRKKWWTYIDEAAVATSATAAKKQSA